MTKLLWDVVGERTYETGVDRGVLYVRATDGTYPTGVAWNGLTTITEAPTGAAVTPQYADNIKYLNLVSVEQFDGTVEAFTYPEEFAACDGTQEPEIGVAIGQQTRKVFGLCYRTRKGNDVAGTDLGYKVHLVYGALAAPSQKAYATVNDTPAAIAFNWAISTVPVDVPGFKPSATLTLDSTKVDATALAALELILYGDVGVNPRLPLPTEVLALFSGTITTITPTVPTYVNGTHTLTIPTQAGVFYTANDLPITAGAHVVAADQLVKAHPQPGFVFTPGVDDDWWFDFV